MLGVCSICLFCTCGDNQACVRDNAVMYARQLDKDLPHGNAFTIAIHNVIGRQKVFPLLQ